jgi:hypothetical protein
MNLKTRNMRWTLSFRLFKGLLLPPCALRPNSQILRRLILQLNPTSYLNFCRISWSPIWTSWMSNWRFALWILIHLTQQRLLWRVVWCSWVSWGVRSVSIDAWLLRLFLRSWEERLLFGAEFVSWWYFLQVGRGFLLINRVKLWSWALWLHPLLLLKLLLVVFIDHYHCGRGPLWTYVAFRRYWQRICVDLWLAVLLICNLFQSASGGATLTSNYELTSWVWLGGH